MTKFQEKTFSEPCRPSASTSKVTPQQFDKNWARTFDSKRDPSLVCDICGAATTEAWCWWGDCVCPNCVPPDRKDCVPWDPSVHSRCADTDGGGTLGS